MFLVAKILFLGLDNARKTTLLHMLKDKKAVVWKMDAHGLYIAYKLDSDLIEEDALNRKCCVEVLRRSIPRMDAEIEELEGELFVLETQLEWAAHNKYKDWFEFCCKGLGKQINSLELSLQSLKNEYAHSNAAKLPALEGPVKQFYELMKDLLRDGFLDADKQPANLIVKDLESDVLSPDSSESVEVQEYDVTSSTGTVSLDSSLMLQVLKEKDINLSEQVAVQKSMKSAIDSVQEDDSAASASITNPKTAWNFRWKEEKHVRQEEEGELKSGKMTTNDVHEDEFAASTSIVTINSSSVVQGVKDKCIRQSEQEEVHESVKSSIYEIIEDDVSASPTTIDLGLSLALRKKKKKSISQPVPLQVCEPIKSAVEVLSSKSSLKLQEKRSEDIIHSDISKGHNSSFACCSGKAILNSKQKNAKIQKNECRSNKINDRKPGTALTADNGMPSKKQSGKRSGKVDVLGSSMNDSDRDIIWSDIIKGQNSSFASSDSAIMSKSIVYAKLKVAKEQKSEVPSDLMDDKKPVLALARPSKKQKTKVDAIGSSVIMGEDSYFAGRDNAITSKPMLISKQKVAKMQKNEVQSDLLNDCKPSTGLAAEQSMPSKKRRKQSHNVDVLDSSIICLNDMDEDSSFTSSENAITSKSKLESKQKVGNARKNKVHSDMIHDREPGLTLAVKNDMPFWEGATKQSAQLEILDSSLTCIKNSDSLSLLPKRTGKKKRVHPPSDVLQDTISPATYSHMSLDSLFNLQKRKFSKDDIEAVEEKEPVLYDKHQNLLEHPKNETKSCNNDESQNAIVPVPERINLVKCKVHQLKSLAQLHKIKGYSKMRKADLVEILTEIVG